MNATVTIPCPPLEPISIPSIQLPVGAELKGMADFSAGLPSKCNVYLNLMVQLGPLLASMGCILKILEVLGKVVDFAKVATDPENAGEAAKNLGTAFEDLKACIPPLGVPSFVLMIKDILNLVINVLTCLTDRLASIFQFQMSLDLAAAEGNPVLTEALECARGNADQSVKNLLTSIEPIIGVMKVVESVGSMANLDVTLPDLSTIGQAGGAAAAIQSLTTSIDELKSAVGSLPD